MPETILEEALRITSVDRNKQYGAPEDTFSEIAMLWSAYLTVQYSNTHITAKDVAHLMILMKIAREKHGHKRDNYVDIAGYARCASRCAGDEDEEAQYA